ncbi:MAG: aldo/keto reductase [Rhodobacteraceae bacterium]|nr:aldo/keto reductase [Paracoccaceae bacterium]
MKLATRHWDRHKNGGLSFTELGFGTAPFGNLYTAIDDAEARAILECAWGSGVRYFDTAPLYGFGLAETRLGAFLRNRPRDSFTLSSKVGRLLRATTPDRRDGIGKWFDVPSRREIYDYGYDGVLRSLEFSLERLGLDRIDILYAHDLDVFNHGSRKNLDARLREFMQGGYRALLRLRDEGVIHAFGAGVNEWEPAEWLAERGDFDIFLLAGRYTLLEQRAAQSFLPLCRRRGIGLTIGGPYNSGILASGPRAGAYYNYAPAPAETIERVTRIDAICARHGVRMIDAAFQFPLRESAVLSVMPGGQSVDQMNDNLQASRADIPAALWQELKAAGLLEHDND